MLEKKFSFSKLIVVNNRTETVLNHKYFRTEALIVIILIFSKSSVYFCYFPAAKLFSLHHKQKHSDFWFWIRINKFIENLMIYLIFKHFYCYNSLTCLNIQYLMKCSFIHNVVIIWLLLSVMAALLSDPVRSVGPLRSSGSGSVPHPEPSGTNSLSSFKSRIIYEPE